MALVFPVFSGSLHLMTIDKAIILHKIIPCSFRDRPLIIGGGGHGAKLKKKFRGSRKKSVQGASEKKLRSVNLIHKGASIFFNGFQNLNNVRIGVGGWAMTIWLFGFQNPLVLINCFRLQKCNS